MILYEVIDYLASKIGADDVLPHDINVIEAYKYSHKLTNSELQVQVIDHTEYERFTTFDDGKIYICPLQIDVYAKQMKIGDETMSAQKSAYTIAQKIINFLNVNDLNGAIPGIISARNGTYTSAYPVADVGTIMYRCVVRIDLYLEHN